MLALEPIDQSDFAGALQVERPREKGSGTARRQLIAWRDLLALEAQKLDASPSDAARPGRIVLVTNREISGAAQHIDGSEVVCRNGAFPPVGREPALAIEKTRHALALRDMLGLRP